MEELNQFLEYTASVICFKVCAHFRHFKVLLSKLLAVAYCSAWMSCSKLLHQSSSSLKLKPNMSELKDSHFKVKLWNSQSRCAKSTVFSLYCYSTVCFTNVSLCILIYRYTMAYTNTHIHTHSHRQLSRRVIKLEGARVSRWQRRPLGTEG